MIRDLCYSHQLASNSEAIVVTSVDLVGVFPNFACSTTIHSAFSAPYVVVCGSVRGLIVAGPFVTTKVADSQSR